MCRSRKFSQRGSNSDIVFLVDEGRREDPNTTTISGPSMAFRWHTNDSPTWNAGLVALDFSGDQDQLLRNPIFL